MPPRPLPLPPDGRPQGCICDGSGWTARLERRQNHVPVYAGRNVVGSETIDVVDEIMVRCPACASLALQQRLAAECGLLDSELAVNLDDAIGNGPDTAHMLAMAREFCRQPWGMWIVWGGYGNAKTLVLQAVVNHFRQKGILAVYVRFKDLLDYIRAGNRPGLEEDDDARRRYRRLLDVAVLAIDEVDKANLTAYADEFRSAFLDDRWRYGCLPDTRLRRHTLLAMNCNPIDLPGHIYDRLRDGRFGCFLDGQWHNGITENRDQSMRPAMHRNAEDEKCQN